MGAGDVLGEVLMSWRGLSRIRLGALVSRCARGGCAHSLHNDSRQLRRGRARDELGRREAERQRDVAQMADVKGTELGEEDALALLIDFIWVEERVRPIRWCRRIRGTRSSRLLEDRRQRSLA